jgi:c-di-GMP-binding flagellar brake protein YcgR
MYHAWVDAWHNFRASDTEIIISLTCIGAIVAFFLIHNQWATIQEKRKRLYGVVRAFRNACRSKGLIVKEMDNLRKYARRIDQPVQAGLVQSSIEFDRFVDRVLRSSPQSELPELNSFFGAVRHKLGFRPPPRGLALNSTRELPAGQFVYIALPQDIYLEGIVRAVDETMLSVRLLSNIPIYASLKVGGEIRIFFNRTGDSRYAGTCFVRNVTSDEEGEFIILEHCRKLRRDQRRMDFRVDEDRPVLVWLLEKELAKEPDPTRHLDNRMPSRALLDDLSGGGASIIFHRALEPGQVLYINLDPTALYGLPVVRGVVIRTSQRGKTNRWAVSIRFEDMSRSAHYKLVNYIFMREREHLQGNEKKPKGRVRAPDVH